MKKLTLFTLLALFITTLSVNAQWELQNPLPTDVLLNDVYFIDSINGWAVGV